MTTIAPSSMPYTDAQLWPHVLLALHDAIAYAKDNDLARVILATYTQSQLVQAPQEDEEASDSSLLPSLSALPVVPAIDPLDDQIDVPAYFAAAVEMDVAIFSVPERLRSRKPGEPGETVVHLLAIVEEELTTLQTKAIVRMAPRDGRFDPIRRLEAAHIKPRLADRAD